MDDKHIAGYILCVHGMCHKHILHSVKRASVTFCAAPHIRRMNKHLFDIFHHIRDFFFSTALFFAFFFFFFSRFDQFFGMK